MKEQNKSSAIGLQNFLFIFCFLFIAMIVVRNAWMTDDAFITLRSIDNWVNGYGLTWNVSERVQTFTHPLWLFVLSFPYFLTREPFYTSLFINIAISIAVIFFLLNAVKHSNEKLIIITLMLALSKSFIDFSTSGLENALSHLIVILFFLQFMRSFSALDEKQFTKLALIAAFGMTNRHDLALVFLPVLVWGVFKLGKRSLLPILIGMLPFILWELFSLIYYGFPFPNTAYAKLNTGIGLKQLMIQGVFYFLDLLKNDPLTFLCVSLGLLLPFMAVNAKPLWLAAAGMLLYLVYIVYIGGDYMSGRFFSVPLILSVLIITHMPINISWTETSLIVLLTLILGLTPLENSTLMLPLEGANASESGIINEKAFNFMGTGLITRDRFQNKPESDWVDAGLELKTQEKKTAVVGPIGMTGYYAGPGVYILDVWALGDPLLARIQLDDVIHWRIGHFRRKIPEGYEESILQNRNLLKNPDLKTYYDVIRLITRGELFSPERLQAIFDINTGKYKYLNLPKM